MCCYLPYLQFDYLLFRSRNAFELEINANGRDKLIGEHIIAKSQKKSRFSCGALAHDQYFHQIIAKE